jgi:hypothetical protein
MILSPELSKTQFYKSIGTNVVYFSNAILYTIFAPRDVRSDVSSFVSETNEDIVLTEADVGLPLSLMK